MAPHEKQARESKTQKRQRRWFRNCCPFVGKGVANGLTTAYPARATAYPARATAYPTRTAAYPVRAAAYPVRATAYPTRTAAYPAREIGRASCRERVSVLV